MIPNPKKPEEDGPALEQADWDALADGATPDATFENGDLRYDEEEETESLEEDDDNPYQESDEALPDDEEEKSIADTLSPDDRRTADER